MTIGRLASYEFPDTPEELYFLICYISRMIEVLKKAYPIKTSLSIAAARPQQISGRIKIAWKIIEV